MPLIPVRCMRCGDDNISAVYRSFKETVAERKKGMVQEEDMYFNKDLPISSIEGALLDELKITKLCCRMHLLTHVDIH